MKIKGIEINEISYAVIVLSIIIGLSFSGYITATSIGANYNDQPVIKWSIELGIPSFILVFMNFVYIRISKWIFKD